MKLKRFCDECSCPTGSVDPSKLTVVIPKGKQYLIEITDKCLYEFTCEHGHLNRFFISNPKYELLFEMGLCAYYKGFYREAVLDFAASLERFYESCINIFIIKQFPDIKTHDEILLKLWKPISKQSERQYGAFISTFLLNMKRMPSLFQESLVTFRNKVTHQGYFPTKEETIKYANAVAKYIIEINSTIANASQIGGLTNLRCLESCQVTNQLKKELKEKGIENEGVYGYPIFCFFRNHYSLDDKNWFELMLKDFEKRCLPHYDI